MGPGGAISEGQYITNGISYADQSGVVHEMPGNLPPYNPPPPAAANVVRLPVATHDPRLGDPREIAAPDEAIRAAAAYAQAPTPPAPVSSPATREFLLYIPLDVELTGVVKILGPQSSLTADHIDLLVEHLILHKRLLEKHHG